MAYSWTPVAPPVPGQWYPLRWLGIGWGMVRRYSTDAYLFAPDFLSGEPKVLPYNTSWQDIAISPGGLIMAVADDDLAAVATGWSTFTGITPPNWRAGTVVHDGTDFVVCGPYIGGESAHRTPDGGSWASFAIGGANARAGGTNGAGVTVIMHQSNESTCSVVTGTSVATGTLPSNGYWSAPVWNGSVFVTVAYGSDKAATSPDGLVWTQRTLPSVKDWYYVAALETGELLAIAEGEEGFLAGSVDNGITWTDEGTLTPSPDWWWAITGGDGRFVAIDYSGNLAISNQLSGPPIDPPAPARSGLRKLARTTVIPSRPGQPYIPPSTVCTPPPPPNDGGGGLPPNPPPTGYYVYQPVDPNNPLAGETRAYFAGHPGGGYVCDTVPQMYFVPDPTFPGGLTPVYERRCYWTYP